MYFIALRSKKIYICKIFKANYFFFGASNLGVEYLLLALFSASTIFCSNESSSSVSSTYFGLLLVFSLFSDGFHNLHKMSNSSSNSSSS